MKKKEEGFTLIELLVVIGILAVLTVAFLVTLNPVDQLHKAYDARRKSDLAQIQRALQTYYQDNNKYPGYSYNSANPSDPSNYEIEPGVAPGVTPTPVPWNSSWQPYINVLPADPGGNKYIYYSSGGQSYYLYASLDRGSLDSQACNGGLVCSSLSLNSISSTACGGTCNYGVSSPNVSP